MSNAALNHVWKHSKQTGSALLVLIAIADAANDDGECYPGVSKLSEKCRMSERNLQLIIRRLEADGELAVDVQSGIQTGHGKTNRYRILFHEGVKATTPQAVKSDDAEADGVKQPSPLGVKQIAPNPSVEPPVKTTTVSPNGETPRAKSERKPPPHEPIYQALLEAQGLTPATMTATARKPYYVAAAELHSIAFPVEAVRELVVYVRNKAETEEWRSWGAMALSKYAPEFLARYKAFVKPAEAPPQPEPAADDYDDGLIAVDDALLAEFDALVASKTGGVR